MDPTESIDPLDDAEDAVNELISTPHSDTVLGLPTDPVERRERIKDLVDTIKLYADKLEEDDSSRGDLKILSRTLRELRYAFKVFTPYRDRRKVTVFGSARTPSDDATYQLAIEFGKRMAAHNWMVVTGAASGIMEAGHRGAGREHSMGLNIMLPFEQYANPIIAGDHKLVHMKYFFTRKLMFVKECHAVCCLRGGFGTLDEGLEVLTLLQTGKRDPVPILFLEGEGESYWADLDAYIRKQLLGNGMISPEDLSLYKITGDVEVGVAEVLDFYKVYHSMRYVRNKLVFRLNEPLNDKLLAAINEEYADILKKGTFQQQAALSEEEDEPYLAEKSRLVFQFDRRSLGRLRQLINSLNAGRVIARSIE